MEEQNCINEGPKDVVAAEVEGPGDGSAVEVLGPRDVGAPEVGWRQKNNSKPLHSHVIIKEETLDMWGFSDAVVVEV